MSQASLDIILPCYNPPGNWTQKVIQSYSQIKEALSEIQTGLIIVNDGSAKGISTHEIEELKKQIPEVRFEKNISNEGKGSALRKGVAVSMADFQVYTDIDFPYKESNVIEMYQLLQSGNSDVVIGTRSREYYKSVPAIRVALSKFLKFIIRIFFNIPTADTQAGLKGFNRKGKEIFLQTKINRYLFDLEFIYLAAHRKDIKIVCTPLTLKEGIVFSRMNWKALTLETFNFLKIFFRKI